MAKYRVHEDGDTIAVFDTIEEAVKCYDRLVQRTRYIEVDPPHYFIEEVKE